MRILFPIAALLCLDEPLAAQAVEVDVELFLAVDVSRSMSASELEIQRQGYAAALVSDEVMSAIENGLTGRIAVTYVEWAGDTSHNVVVPWTLVGSIDDAVGIANTITAHFNPGMRRTSISGVLDFATRDIRENDIDGLRRVIDISGDGPNNQGAPVLEAREAALAEGMIINGLPVMTSDALSEVWGIPDLDDYYRNCVIGGPGAFVIPVLSWSQFAEAIKRKLVLEIAALPDDVTRVHYHEEASYDCLIGEKRWARNQRYYSLP
ncbi:DUF1194 domain-containing protein [Sulfitobacter sp. LCG007]